MTRKNLTIVIDTCLRCDWLQTAASGVEDWCGLSDRLTPFEREAAIPDWCLLPGTQPTMDDWFGLSEGLTS